MSKSVSKKKTAKKFEMVYLGPKTVNRNRELGTVAEREYKEIGDLVFEYAGERPTKIANFLTLSAARAKIADRGYLYAINCRNMYADTPGIDFMPQETSFGGKIQVWLQNIDEGQNLHIQFRVSSGYGGMWKISSSETVPQQVPIIPLYQSIDFFIPAVEVSYGQVLIELEPLFTNGGTWGFTDVIVKKLN